jgi:hypothetical protein
MPNDLNLRAIANAIGSDGNVSLTATQNRHNEEESPNWTLRIEATVQGVNMVIENDAPGLAQVIDDTMRVLVSLGVDIHAEIDRLMPEVEARLRAKGEIP